MMFVSAQQDNRYCLWQLYVQMANFRRLGIEDKATVLVAYYDQPSWEVLRFAEQTTATVRLYPDTRINKTYTASVYFHLVSKFIRDTSPSCPIFFHDGDVIFRELPDQAIWSSDTNVFSDTSNYLGPQLYDEHAMALMCQHVGISYDMIVDKPVGGAQYLFKEHDATFWDTVENRSWSLHHFMKTSEVVRKAPKKHIDPWLAGMWALLWTAYERNYPITTSPDLNFTWPVYSASTWYKTKILHNAGVMPSESTRLFHKGSYTERSPFYEDLSFVDRSKASYFYALEVAAAGRIFNPGF